MFIEKQNKLSLVKCLIKMGKDKYKNSTNSKSTNNTN